MNQELEIFNLNSTPSLGILLAILSVLPIVLIYTLFKPKFIRKDAKDKKLALLEKIRGGLYLLNILLLVIFKSSFDIKTANLPFGVMVFSYIIYYELFFRFISRGRAHKELYSRLLYVRIPWFIAMSLSLVFGAIWSKSLVLIIASIMFSIINIYTANYKYLKLFTEYRDLYDSKRRKTGKKMLKDAIHPKNLKHITVAVLIYNPVTNMWLVQKRSKDKGSKWGTTSGHPVSGESSVQGMITEIKEEIGLDVSKEELELVTTVESKKKFLDIYYMESNVDILDLKIQEEEVQEVKWMTSKDIEALYLAKKVKKSHYELFDIVRNKLNKR